MNIDQIAIFTLLAGVMVGFVVVRRFELVALTGLAVGGLLGLVPTSSLFSGFANPAVITVIEILLIVEVLKRSSLLEAVAGRLGSRFTDDRALIVSLCAVGAVLSAFMNNIGALALMLPLSISLCQRYGVPLEKAMMPLSFATLLGGLCSVVGTPANLLGALAIEGQRGAAFGFFELGLIGLPVTVIGLAYLWFAIPKEHVSDAAPVAMGRDQRIHLTEHRVAAQSPLLGLGASEVATRHGLKIHNIVRNGAFAFGRGVVIEEGDLAIVEGPAETIAALVPPVAGERDETIVHAVVMPESIYVGSAIADLAGLEDAGIAVTQVAITPRRVEARLGDVKLSLGDILVLRGDARTIARECEESGLLPIAPTRTRDSTPDYVPLGMFVAGIIAAAFFAVEPAIAFGCVVLALALSGHLSLRRGFEGLNWSILILLGAMIPLGNAVADTGAASALAQMLAAYLPGAGLVTITALMLGLAIILTPFVNNPTTVLVLAPIGVALAQQYGLPPVPILVAITVGASLDFLTPFGHHNNTLVMGIANYRFGDYARFGWPLVALCAVVVVVLVPLLY